MRPPLVYCLEDIAATILAALDRQKRLMERSEVLIQEAQRRLPAAETSAPRPDGRGAGARRGEQRARYGRV